MNPLTAMDFPLFCVGPLVYRRTQSSAMFQAANEYVAVDLATRLNRDHFSTLSVVRPDMASTFSLPIKKNMEG